MRASEILRGLADLIDNAEGEQSSVVTPQQAAYGQTSMSKFTPVNQEPASIQDAGTFVPPLQAKIELLKKAVDVDSIYDQCDPDQDLSRMRKMAGINPAVTDEAASDEPFDG
jgi:hypothetical protein